MQQRFGERNAPQPNTKFEKFVAPADDEEDEYELKIKEMNKALKEQIRSTDPHDDDAE